MRTQHRNVIKKNKEDVIKSLQHATQIENVPLNELKKKPRQYLVEQLDLRKVALTNTERRIMSRDDLAQRINASDTEFFPMTRT